MEKIKGRKDLKEYWKINSLQSRAKIIAIGKK